MKDYVECIVAVNAIMIFGDEILLQRVVKRDNKIWLPWWKVDIWESFKEALEREIFEETWIKWDLYDFERVAILHDVPNTTCKHIYVLNLKNKFDKFNFNDTEISKCFWVKLDEIPNNVELYRKPWVYSVIQDYKKWIFDNRNKLYTLD